MSPEPEAAVRGYYRALDAGDYDRLGGLLAADFVHERPDRTLDGRERFLRFMREERPLTDTSHPLDAVYRRVGSGGDGEGGADAAELCARGRLLRADGTELTGFVDVFTVADGELCRLRTYTD